MIRIVIKNKFMTSKINPIIKGIPSICQDRNIKVIILEIVLIWVKGLVEDSLPEISEDKLSESGEVKIVSPNKELGKLATIKELTRT